MGAVAGGAVGISHTSAHIAAGVGLLGKAGAAAGAVDMAVAGAMIVGSAAVAAGAVIAGAMILLNKTRTCPPEQCRKCP